MFAVVCVLLATTGHVLMSGRHVPWWAALAALAATSAAAWATADRERGLPAVTTATVAVQAVLHTGFTLAQSAVGAAAPSAHGMHTHTHAALPVDGAMAGMPMNGMPMASAADMADMADMAGLTMSSAGHDMAGMSPWGMSGMSAAHLLAAVLCGLWLAYAERAAFRLLRAVAGWLRAPLRVLFGPLPPVPHRPRLRLRRIRERQVLRRLFLVHAITSRGPPTGTAVL
ncbi:hypothetical protein [Streptomyces sp. NPDC089915]|uniref:hypothetical protein n=1 Tax=Streptomyces sp. NPDC089915 TaxID=3155186 RepID=UPI00343F0AFE